MAETHRPTRKRKAIVIEETPEKSSAEDISNAILEQQPPTTTAEGEEQQQQKWSVNEPDPVLWQRPDFDADIQLIPFSSCDDDLTKLHEWLRITAECGKVEPIQPEIINNVFENPDLSIFKMNANQRTGRAMNFLVTYLNHRHDRLLGIEQYLKRKLETEKDNPEIIAKIRACLDFVEHSVDFFEMDVMRTFHDNQLNQCNPNPIQIDEKELESKVQEMHEMLISDNAHLLESREFEIFHDLLAQDRARLKKKVEEKKGGILDSFQLDNAVSVAIDPLKPPPTINSSLRHPRMRTGLRKVRTENPDKIVWKDAPWQKSGSLVPTGWICPNCHASVWVLDSHNGTVLCTSCGVEISGGMDDRELDYKKRTSTFKHLSHLQKRLIQMEGNEPIDSIPQIYCDLVAYEAVQHGIKPQPSSKFDPRELTTRTVLYYLQIHRHTKFWINQETKEREEIKTTDFYEHVNHIRWRLTDFKPPELTSTQRMQVCAVFMEILPVFLGVLNKVIPGRKNLIRYPDIIWHILELHRWFEFLPFIRAVKWDCQKQQEEVYKETCRILGYEYHPRGID